MALRTRIYRWLVGAMALLTGHFSQVGIMGIRPHAAGLYGKLFSITMAAQTDGRRHNIFWRTFFMAGCTIQSLCAMPVRQKRLSLCQSLHGKIHSTDCKNQKQGNPRELDSRQIMNCMHRTHLSSVLYEGRGSSSRPPSLKQGFICRFLTGSSTSRASVPRHSCRQCARRRCIPSNFRRPDRRISMPTRSLPP